MTGQLDWVAPLTDTPRARNTDPATSHRAAARILPRLRAQQERVLEAVKRFPGSTAVELAHRAGLDRYMVSRRLPELSPIWVRRHAPRLCSIKGTAQTTWHPVDR